MSTHTTFVVPYIAQESPLWCGVDVYNPQEYSVYVKYKVYDNEVPGKVLKDLVAEIEGKGHLLLDKKDLWVNNEGNRSSLEVFGPTYLMVSATSSNFGMLPVFTYDSVDTQDESRVLVIDEPWVEYCGSSICSYITKEAYRAVGKVALTIYNDYPYRNDRVFILGDASTSGYAECDGHPGGSHSNSSGLDTDYYTFDTNSTQYGDNKTVIWSDELLDVFDVERNAEFALRMKSMMEDISISTNVDIRAKLIEYDASLSWVHGDSGTTYNHHKHYHLKLK